MATSSTSSVDVTSTLSSTTSSFSVTTSASTLSTTSSTSSQTTLTTRSTTTTTSTPSETRTPANPVSLIVTSSETTAAATAAPQLDMDTSARGVASNQAAIIGGATGGAFLALVLLFLLFKYRRHVAHQIGTQGHQPSSPSDDDPENQRQPPSDDIKPEAARFSATPSTTRLRDLVWNKSFAAISARSSQLLSPPLPSTAEKKQPPTPREVLYRLPLYHMDDDSYEAIDLDPFASAAGSAAPAAVTPSSASSTRGGRINTNTNSGVLTDAALAWWEASGTCKSPEQRARYSELEARKRVLMAAGSGEPRTASRAEIHSSADDLSMGAASRVGSRRRGSSSGRTSQRGSVFSSRTRTASFVSAASSLDEDDEDDEEEEEEQYSEEDDRDVEDDDDDEIDELELGRGGGRVDAEMIRAQYDSHMAALDGTSPRSSISLRYMASLKRGQSQQSQQSQQEHAAPSAAGASSVYSLQPTQSVGAASSLYPSYPLQQTRSIGAASSVYSSNLHPFMTQNSQQGRVGLVFGEEVADDLPYFQAVYQYHGGDEGEGEGGVRVADIELSREEDVEPEEEEVVEEEEAEVEAALADKPDEEVVEEPLEPAESQEEPEEDDEEEVTVILNPEEVVIPEVAQEVEKKTVRLVPAEEESRSQELIEMVQDKEAGPVAEQGRKSLEPTDEPTIVKTPVEAERFDFGFKG